MNVDKLHIALHSNNRPLIGKQPRKKTVISMLLQA